VPPVVRPSIVMGEHHSKRVISLLY